MNSGIYVASTVVVAMDLIKEVVSELTALGSTCYAPLEITHVLLICASLRIS